MSKNLNHYRQLEFAWTLARLAAGGRLTTTEEVVWTEAIGNVWRTLTDDEKEAVEAEPPEGLTTELLDQEVELGQSAQERLVA